MQIYLADKNRYENKLRNREVGTAWRRSRKRAVYWRDRSAGDVSEETSLFTYPFSERVHGRHDISLISCYLNRVGLVAYMGAA